MVIEENSAVFFLVIGVCYCVNVLKSYLVRILGGENQPGWNSLRLPF